MADTKLSALTAITSLDDADLLLTTDTSAAASKKITRANFVIDMAATTQTLTNKSIDQDGTGNSITNLADASIKAAAAISVNKLAALTASEIAITDASGFLASAAVATYPSLTELAYAKGVTSAIQTQIDTKMADLSDDTTPTLGGTLAAGGFDVTGLGTVSLIEQASANADVAGSGQVWVKTATPNQLWFTDDAGTDTQLGTSHAPEGTAVLSTGEVGGTKYLREDGDGTSSWQAVAGGGDVSKVGTPVNSQVGVWTGDGTIEGATSLTYDGSNLQLTGDIGSTGTKITKGWYTDLAVTNAIAGSVTGNAATVTSYTPASGSLTLSGADAVTITTTATTNVTLPTTGTVATLAGTETLTGKTIAAGSNTATIFTESHAASHTLSAAECYGGVYYVTAAATLTLPAVAAGMHLTVITIGAVAVSVDPNASDLIYLDGTALDDGDKVTNASTAGDIAVLTYYDATGWHASTNSWTDGGA
jgi:hypothetical protein